MFYINIFELCTHNNRYAKAKDSGKILSRKNMTKQEVAVVRKKERENYKLRQQNKVD